MPAFTLTTGDDSFTGTTGDDTIEALAGWDTVSGGQGNDSIDGAEGEDRLAGDAGDDTLAGGDNDDVLRGGAGDDVVDGGAGLDWMDYSVGATGPVTINLWDSSPQNTGQGWDTLLNIEHVSGTAFNDLIGATSDNNWIWGGGGGNDSINAGEGADLVEISAGDHVLWGGDGLDYLSFHGYGVGVTGGVTASLALQGTMQSTGQGTMFFSDFEGLSGTTYADTLSGDAGASYLEGNIGDDLLIGLAGDDNLGGDGWVNCRRPGAGNGGTISLMPDASLELGPAGSDTLDGGDGNDILRGHGGDDLLIGGLDNDDLQGNDGVDTASYEAASGSVFVDLAGGTASGADGDDTLSDVENVVGSDYDDQLLGSSADNVIQAGKGHDFVRAGDGDDQITGGEGHDYLRGDAGKDVIKAGDGDDLLYGNADDDELHGDDGWDRAAYSVGATGGVKVDLNLQGSWQNTGQGYDYLTGIEHLSGTIYDDELTGDDGINWLWGGSNTSGVTGNDTIRAGKGDDLVEVGTGDHVLDGGEDVDTLSFFGNATDITSAGVEASLALQGAPQWTLQGSMDFNDFENLSGSIYDDTLAGDEGANLLAGSAGGDDLYGDGGDDVLLGDGQVRVDSHGTGTSGPIVTDTDITWNGGSFAGGDDTLDGGKGNDALTGGVGADDLWGAGGEDTFIYTRLEDSPTGAGSRDQIWDLEKVDWIDVSGIDADVTAAGDQAFTLVGAFSGAAGELTLDWDPLAGSTFLRGDVDGDGVADFEVEILNNWTSFSNFVL